jgi:tRNA(Arg) A34 adenosine deaminase TadA
MNHEHYLKLARECSANASYQGGNKVKLGCVIVYKGAVLAKGWNMNRTHTDQAYYNTLRYRTVNKYCPALVHAEMMALAKIKYLDIDFSKVTVYIWREYKDGSPAMSRPCPSCMGAIKERGVGQVVYSTPEGYAIEKIFNKKA